MSQHDQARTARAARALARGDHMARPCGCVRRCGDLDESRDHPYAVCKALPLGAEKWPPDWWYHEKHGLHDEAHHQHHSPLDLCVPLNIVRPS
jgi:hypothetical protein